ncbi:hypothetical protein BCR39DRAFT_562364 [Naematelia encephala]|uniref:Uncharacterized protein n=1 Tax=Naematelia encephala TaxID=71784 RepID=A0A1Y2AIB1_9TREE|nr:hypothetical protein BCR39DRAFT_562364 [Naematelia encephala]
MSCLAPADEDLTFTFRSRRHSGLCISCSHEPRGEDQCLHAFDNVACHGQGRSHLSKLSEVEDCLESVRHLQSPRLDSSPLQLPDQGDDTGIISYTGTDDSFHSDHEDTITQENVSSGTTTSPSLSEEYEETGSKRIQAEKAMLKRALVCMSKALKAKALPESRRKRWRKLDVTLDEIVLPALRDLRKEPFKRTQWHNRGGYFMDLPLAYYLRYQARIKTGDRDRSSILKGLVDRAEDRPTGRVVTAIRKFENEQGRKVRFRGPGGCLSVKPKRT